MQVVIDSISIALLFVAGLVLFGVLMKMVFPMLILKVRVDLARGLGRGYKRFVYPTGRAAVYEPHPSVRKYVNKYLLFVNDGYKYLKCRVDKGVSSLKYTVVMLNNKDKVVDTVVVNEDIGDTCEGASLLLHPDTSYVALNIDEVDGQLLKAQSHSSFSLLRLALYFAAVLLSSFLTLLLSAFCTEEFALLAFKASVPVSNMAGTYLLWALLIAALSLAFLLLYCRKKGIRVVLYGKK